MLGRDLAKKLRDGVKGRSVVTSSLCGEAGALVYTEGLVLNDVLIDLVELIVVELLSIVEPKFWLGLELIQVDMFGCEFVLRKTGGFAVSPIGVEFCLLGGTIGGFGSILNGWILLERRFEIYLFHT